MIAGARRMTAPQPGSAYREVALAIFCWVAVGVVATLGSVGVDTLESPGACGSVV